MSKKDKKELGLAFLLLVVSSFVCAGGVLIMIAILDSM